MVSVFDDGMDGGSDDDTVRCEEVLISNINWGIIRIILKEKYCNTSIQNIQKFSGNIYFRFLKACTSNHFVKSFGNIETFSNQLHAEL